MLDLSTHTAAAFGAPESSQLAIRVQLTDAVKHGVTPVRACLNIPPPSPFLPYTGKPPLPWFVVFSTYLHLLEEDLGEPWPDFIQNALLFGLLGAGDHQQLAGSPVIHTLHSAYFADFAQRIAGCFASSARTTQHARD